MRRRISILIAMPIAAIGSLVAHQVSYLLSAPDVGLRARLLAATGHGYLRWAPMLVGVVGVTLLVGLLVEAHRSGRARSVGFPAWPVALVAPLAFAMQEHVERLLHVGAFPTGLLASLSLIHI